MPLSEVEINLSLINWQEVTSMEQVSTWENIKEQINQYKKATWLQMIHCFNHQVELALKDAFKTTAFEDIDTMLCKLSYLYQKSAMHLSELRALSEAYDKTIPKPTKASGTCQVDSKWRAMEILFKNYGDYISHLEHVSFTDSQALNGKKLKDK